MLQVVARPAEPDPRPSTPSVDMMLGEIRRLLAAGAEPALVGTDHVPDLEDGHVVGIRHLLHEEKVSQHHDKGT